MGQRKKSRVCTGAHGGGVNNCPGKAEDVQACNLGLCPGEPTLIREDISLRGDYLKKEIWYN